MTHCRLCEIEKPLVDSHVIPRFVGQYLKETGATGFLTAISQNSRPSRAQDIFTMKLLCEDCEQLISTSETFFHQAIFVPFTENSLSHIEVDTRLARFVISVSLRSLWVHKEIGDPLVPKYASEFQALEAEWRRILRSKSYIQPHLPNSHHILLGSVELLSHGLTNFPNILHSVFRSSGFFLYEVFDKAFLFSNLAGIQIISMITPAELPASHGTQVHPVQTFGIEKPCGIGWGGYFQALMHLDERLSVGRANQTPNQVSRADRMMNTPRALGSADVAILTFQEQYRKSMGEPER
jgi:hypothetical protein